MMYRTHSRTTGKEKLFNHKTYGTFSNVTLFYIDGIAVKIESHKLHGVPTAILNVIHDPTYCL